MKVTVISCAAVAVTMVRPVENATSKVRVTGIGDAGTVIVPITVPLAAVLSYTVTTPVATGLLKVMVWSIPAPLLATVVVGAASVMLRKEYPTAVPVLVAISF